MFTRIKTILIVLFCMTFVLSYSFACTPASVDLIQKGSKSQTGNTDDDVISQKLDELKDKLVSPPVILSHKSGEIIYGSGDRELVFIKGYADKGNTIEIYVNGVLDQSNIVVDNNGNFETLNGVEINEGKNIIKLVAVKPSGVRSSPTEFTLFLDVPQKVEYKVYDNNENLKEIEGVYYTEEDNPSVYIRGTHLPLSDVYVQVNDKVIGKIESDNDGIFELEDIILKSGNNEIAVWAETLDGFISAPVFTGINVLNDLDTPYPSSLSGYNQGNANYLNWTASVDNDFDSYKLVRVEDPCTNPEYPGDDTIATFSDITANSYVDSDIISGRSYYYTLWTLDKAGRVVSSNVVAIPKPVYSIEFVKVPSSVSNTIARREWFYQAYELTNTGNVTINVQPIMLWLKLIPNPDEEMEIAPLWEVHIWNPANGQYYYSNEEIYSTYISDWRNFDGTTETETTTTFSEDGLTKTVVETSTTKRTREGPVNLKRIMTTTKVTTITETDLTGVEEPIEKVTTDTSTEIVEPELVGSPIEGLKPGEKRIIEVKVQNIAAENGEKIIVHFHFAPVDCDGRFYIDEIKSTLDIEVIGESRN